MAKLIRLDTKAVNELHIRLMNKEILHIKVHFYCTV